MVYIAWGGWEGEDRGCMAARAYIERGHATAK